MYAIIETGGKQYKVAPGDTIRVERLPAEEGASIEFDRVLALTDDQGKTVIGTPYVEGASVTCRCVRHGKGRKIRVFKYKAKSNYRRRLGHRQWFTDLKIEAIRV
ncbi:MAG TPA: 50S ribosomal protein L21 [Clostridia bacterium]|nr:50S ribosomal protein L21 [Clostridia bacterium]